jgi:hypothetical protein
MLMMSILSNMNISNTMILRKTRIASQIKRVIPALSNAAGVAGLGFPIAFVAGTTALEINQPGYNRVTDTISELVWGPAGWVENVLFLAFAVVLVGFALKIRPALIPLVAAALGFVIIAIFPTTASGAQPTLESLIHQYTAQGIALALPAACFSLARNLKPKEQYRFIVTCSLTAGAVGIFLNLVGFLAIYGETGWVGAAERLVMLNGLIWLQIIGIHTWQVKRKSTTACCGSTGRQRKLEALVGRIPVQPAAVKATSSHDGFPYR